MRRIVEQEQNADRPTLYFGVEPQEDGAATCVARGHTCLLRLVWWPGLPRYAVGAFTRCRLPRLGVSRRSSGHCRWRETAEGQTQGKECFYERAGCSVDAALIS